MGELVKLSHDRDLALVPWLDHLLEEDPILTISDWVLNTIEQVSGVLGVSFKGIEHLAWELFAKLEKRIVPIQGQGMDRETGDKAKMSKELKNLKWGVSYDKKKGVLSVKGLGGGPEGCDPVPNEV